MRRCSKPKAASKAAAAAGAPSIRRVQPHVSRQQRRQAQRQQRDVDQQKIKELEHQLGALRVHLQSLTIQNKQLKQRQSALNATLEMQQQIRAAAAAAERASNSAASGSAAPSWRSDEDAEELSFALEGSDSGSEGGREVCTEEEATFDRLLAMAQGTGPGGRAGRAPDPAAQAPQAPCAGSALNLSGIAEAGEGEGEGSESVSTGSRLSPSSWFFAATLRQHIQWYQQQVDRLQQLLAVLDAIPPRLGRTLEEYQQHEETLDAIQGVLADIDDWTIHMAALRPDDFGIVIHNNLAEVLVGGPGATALPPSVFVAEDWEPETIIWQELVEKLALSPQQEQTLEAHQALFEQRAQTLAGSKAAVLAALSEAAARQDDTTLLEGAEALKASLQQDFSLKAPVMISLRKVLMPMQMARLTVDCWPYYTTMKNLSRAHKQRKQAGRR